MATGNTNALSKYQNTIMESHQVGFGSPAVYQLKPKTETNHTLKRVTLGKKNVNEINKTILLVGETGAGKSTLINALVNYTMGVKWEDNVWFKIVEDRERAGEGERSQTQSQTQSQTSDVIVYQIFGFEGRTLPYSLTIIDTPGYGDTRKDKKDEMISERLLQWFSSDFGIHEINAVGLVLKASDNRLSDRLRYVFDSVVSLFGKNMKNNIVALITHSDGGPPDNALKALQGAKIKIPKNTENQPLHYLFNNRQTTERTSQHMFSLKFAWDFTMDQTLQFTEFLTNAAPQRLNTTISVINERNKLNACIRNLQSRVEFIELKQNMIRQEREILKNYEDKMKKNENFVEEVDEPYKEKQSIEGGRWGFLWLSYKGAMCCLVCEETCHYEGCIHASGPNDPACVAFKGDNCTVCTKKCRRAAHVKELWIYVNKTRKVKRTREDMKQRYEKSKEGSESKRSLLENLEEGLEKLQAEKHKWLEECYRHVLTLEKIALNVDSLSTLAHLAYLIEKMADPRYADKVQHLTAMKNRMEVVEGIEAALEYQRKMAGKAKH